MLSWSDINEFVNGENPQPEREVIKTDDQWQQQLSAEQYQVTRHSSTEPAFSSNMCSLFEPGQYACVCCDTLLFDADEKFESGSGWPSFTQPVKDNVIAYLQDSSLGTSRIETICNTCKAHLGHVFPDGPEPSGLRYCMNALALKKRQQAMQTATFGGGCFWCTEAMFQKLEGVIEVSSGYSGGQTENPTYQDVCGGSTGHAEVIQIVFDPSVITYKELLQVHMQTHNPTTPNQQGADKGTQYRSIILAHDTQQLTTAEDVLTEMSNDYDQPIVTEIAPFTTFYKAEEDHQNYFQSNSSGQYCQVVIAPKLHSLTERFKDKLKP